MKTNYLYDSLALMFCIIIISFLDYDALILGVSVLFFFVNLFIFTIKKPNKKIPTLLIFFIIFKMFFIMWSFVTSLWAYNPHDVIYYTISLVSRLIIVLNVMFFIILRGVNKFDKMLVLSTFLLCIRILIFVPFSAYGNERIGTLLCSGGGTYGNTSLTYIFGTISCILLFSNDNIVKNKYIKILLFLLFTFYSLVSGSKKEFFFLIIFALSYILWKSKTTSRKIRNLLLLPIILLLVYFILISNDFLYNAMGNRLENFVNFIFGKANDDLSSISRVSFLKDAYLTFIKNPIFGVGLDNFKYFNTYSFVWAENNFFELLADVGIIGFVLYYLPWLLVICNFLKTKGKNKTKFYKQITLFLLILLIDLTMVTYRDVYLQFICSYFFVDLVVSSRVSIRNVETNNIMSMSAI